MLEALPLNWLVSQDGGAEVDMVQCPSHQSHLQVHKSCVGCHLTLEIISVALVHAPADLRKTTSSVGPSQTAEIPHDIL